MGTIVVGIDGSSGGGRALDWALAEAAASGHEVQVVLVWQLPTTPLLPLDLGMQSTTMWDSLPDLYENLALDVVQGSRLRIPEATDVPVRTAATGGDPGTTLVALAQDAVLLVVGSHGHSALTRGFLGSVAAYCLHHATVPVVVVPDRDVAPPGRRHVVVGCDGSAAAEGAVRWAAERARTHGLPLLVLHAAAGSPDEPQDHNRERLGHWVSRALGPDPGVVPALRCEPGSPTARLLAHAQEAEVLVVGDRGRGGFARLLLGSVSSQLAHHAPCPVVVVPARRTGQGTTKES